MDRFKLPSVVVLPSESCGVCTDHLTIPNKSFWPLALAVPEEVSKHFVLTDIKVGKNSCFASASCVPATIFGDPRSPIEYDLGKVESPSMNVYVSAFNKDTSPHEFECEVVGTCDPEHAGRRRPTICGLSSLLIRLNPGEETNVLVASQVPYRINCLHLPPYLRDSIAVTGVHKIVCGALNLQTKKYELLEKPVVLDSASLLEKAGEELRFKHDNNVVSLDMHIRVDLTNTGDQVVMISGALLGTVI